LLEGFNLRNIERTDDNLRTTRLALVTQGL
jgi:hypothetical protein